MKYRLNRPEPIDPIYPPVTKNTDFKDFVAFDIETTGLARNEEIIEIGAVKVSGNKATGKFSMLVKPRKYIPYLIEEVTGITNIMVSDAPEIEEVLPDFLDFIGDSVLLGHNIVSFDSKFICREAANLGINIKNPLFDTLTYAKGLRKSCGLPDKLSLASLTDFFGISVNARHRAFDDALANTKVYFCLKALEKKFSE